MTKSEAHVWQELEAYIWGDKNFYVNRMLDRAGHIRANDAEIEIMLQQQETRILPVWQSKNFVKEGEKGPELAYMQPSQAQALRPFIRSFAFLGVIAGQPYFVFDLSDIVALGDGSDVLSVHEQALTASLGQDAYKQLLAFMAQGRFADLREVGIDLDAEHGAIAAFARGISHWHSGHKFCGACGHETEIKEAGHRRHCLNPDCGRDHFPRTDPAVIMLVVDEQDRALLGRGHNFYENMYSTLAGFVEPGETLEQAVAREVFEEVGVKVGQVEYFASQPWPFPSSLMLGFTARAISTEIKIDPHEIADAQWFTRAELIAGEASGEYRTPRKDSISWALISDWLFAEKK